MPTTWRYLRWHFSYQHTATHTNTLQHTITHCNTLQHTATHCNSYQHTATHFNTLYHTATHWHACDTTATMALTGAMGLSKIIGAAMPDAGVHCAMCIVFIYTLYDWLTCAADFIPCDTLWYPYIVIPVHSNTYSCKMTSIHIIVARVSHGLHFVWYLVIPIHSHTYT